MTLKQENEKLRELVDLLKRMLLARPSEITSFFNELRSLESELSSLSSQGKGVEITDEEIMIYFNNHSDCYADVGNLKHMGIVPALTRSGAIKLVRYFESRLAQSAPDLRGELIKCLDWITREDSPYAIAYGDNPRFATTDKDLTTEEIVDEYLQKEKK